MSASQSVESSRAFLKSPLLLFEKVTCLAVMLSIFLICIFFLVIISLNNNQHKLKQYQYLQKETVFYTTYRTKILNSKSVIPLKKYRLITRSNSSQVVSVGMKLIQLEIPQINKDFTIFRKAADISKCTRPRVPTLKQRFFFSINIFLKQGRRIYIYIQRQERERRDLCRKEFSLRKNG